MKIIIGGKEHKFNREDFEIEYFRLLFLGVDAKGFTEDNILLFEISDGKEILRVYLFASTPLDWESPSLEIRKGLLSLFKEKCDYKKIGFKQNTVDKWCSGQRGINFFTWFYLLFALKLIK